MADGRITIDTRINEKGLNDGLKNIQKSLDNVGEKVKSAGESLTKSLTLPLVAIGGIALKTASDFDSSNRQIQAQLGLSADQAKMFMGAAKDLWKDGFGENLDAVNESIIKVKQNMVGSGEVTQEQLKEMAREALTLSDTFGVDVSEGTRTASTMMKSFGIDSMTAFDMMTWGFQNGLDYSGEFVDTVKEYSPLFSTLGYSAEEMFSILKSGAETGAWNLDKVGDAVKEFGIRVKDGSKTTSDGMAQLSSETNKTWELFKQGKTTGKEVFDSVLEDLGQMDDKVKANQIGVALFGTQWEDLERDVMLAMQNGGKEIEGFEGAVSKAGNVTNESFGKQLQATLRQAQAALEPIGLVLLKMAQEVLPKVQSAIGTVTGWLDKMSPSAKNLSVIIGLLLAALGPILVVAGMMITSIGTLAGAFAAVSLPVWGIIVAVIAVGAALVAAYAKFEGFRNTVNGVFNAVKSIVMTVLATVVGFIQSRLQVIQQFWQENGTMILQAVTVAFNMIKSVISFIMPAVLAIIRFVWNSITGVIDGALKVIMGVIKVFSGLLTGNWGKVWEGAKQILFGAIQFILNFMNLTFIGGIKTGLLNLAKMGIGAIKGMGTGIVGGFKSFIGSANGLVNGMVTKVLGFFKSMYTGAQSVFTMLRNFGMSIFNSLRGVIEAAVRFAVTAVKNHFVGMYNNAVTIFNTIKSAATTIFNAIKGAITNPLQAAKSVAVSIFNGIKSAMVNPIEAAVTTIKNAISKIKSAFSSMKIKIPMPHFSMGVTNKKVAGINVPVPNFDVDWYARGAVFAKGQPGLAGIGDNKRFQEAALPLSPKVLGMIGQKIVDATGMNTGDGGDGNNGPVEARVVIGGYEARAFIEFVTKEQNTQKRGKTRGLRGPATT